MKSSVTRYFLCQSSFIVLEHASLYSVPPKWVQFKLLGFALNSSRSTFFL